MVLCKHAATHLTCCALAAIAVHCGATSLGSSPSIVQFYSTSGAKQDSCWFKGRNTPPKRSFGTLIMSTSDDLQVIKHALRATLEHSSAPAAVLVTIDFKNKSKSPEAEAARIEWVSSHRTQLRAMADDLREMCREKTDVMVAAINVRTSSEDSFRALFAAQPACEGFIVKDGAGACEPSRMWRNSVAYTWGLTTLRKCVKYGLHIDSDVRMKSHQSSAPRPTWVQLAMDALEQRADALSINPLQDRDRWGRAGHPYCVVSASQDCTCQQTRMDNRSWRFMSMGVYAPKVLTVQGVSSCAFYLQATRSFPAYNHASLQAFLMDLDRWDALLPLRLDRPVHHIEKLIEQAAQRVGRFHMMFMRPVDLGVAKIIS
jgi:hypothetical protein